MCGRYVWANRLPLARSVHDMAKQMYGNRKYCDVAWQPLKTWLFDCDEEVADDRGKELTKFNKDSTAFFDVVAQSLWNLANGPNQPWGRSAKNSSVYECIPPHEKVGARGLGVFFFVISKCCTHICVLPISGIILLTCMCTYQSESYVLMSFYFHMGAGLGFCVSSSTVIGESPPHEHVTI